MQATGNDPDILALGHALPLDIRLGLASRSMKNGGALIFDNNLILMQIEAPTEAEIASFNEKAIIRIGDFNSFMLFSPVFRGYSFDLIWSPVISHAQEDAYGLAELELGEHLVLNYVICDEKMIVRALRVGTISPQASAYLAQLQRDVLSRDVDAEQIRLDMERLFSAYPNGLSDDVFNVKSRIGD